MNMAAKAESALGLSDVCLEKFEEQANLLSSTEFTDQDLWKYWVMLFQPSLTNESTLDPTMFNKTLETLSEVLLTQPGANMSKNTWWQALNAVTYYIDHVSGRDRDATMTSVWLGQKGALKRRALDSAVQFAQQ